MKRQAEDQVPNHLHDSSGHQFLNRKDGESAKRPWSSVRRLLGAPTSRTFGGCTKVDHLFHMQYIEKSGRDLIPLNDEVYEVYKPVSGSFDLEVVFFHGFQRGEFEDAERRATGTWTTKDGSCWLNTWLVDQFPQARILAVSYDSGTQVSESQARMDMYLICENLVQSLIDLAGVGQSCPMVLVGHCIGGLVLKAVCVRCEVTSRKQFLENLRGVFFYSTPHSGSHVPVRAVTDGGGPLLEYFAPLNKSSARLHSDFSQLRHKYEWQTYGLFPANESSISSLIHLTGEESSSSLNDASTCAYISVVEEGSCRFDMDKFFTVSNVDHLTICNPVDPRSSNFVLLVCFLKEILIEKEYCNTEMQHHLDLPPLFLVSRGCLDQVIKKLDLENPKLVLLSLVGMDGIGKSTLAKQLLLHIGNQFDFLCFLEFEDVPKEPKWEELEKLVVKRLFKGRGRKVSVENKAPWTLLRGKRVLVVADAVQSDRQILPFLTSNWYGDGSRFVITTCVKKLISGYSSFPDMASGYGFVEYAVPLMSEREAKELFKGVIGHSFLDMVRDQEKLVSEIIVECEGLPLPLQMLGCHLRKELESVGPHPHTELVAGIWRDALLRMRTGNALDGADGNQVWRKLKVIFDQLGEPEQTIFLDLTTFDYYGPKKEQYDLNLLRTAWSTGLSGDMQPLVRSAILNLRGRCFLHFDCRLLSGDIVGPVGKIYIHPALRNMGRWISRQRDKGRNVQDADDLWRFNEEGDNTTLETLSIMLEPTESSRNPMKLGSVKRFARLRLLRLSHVNMREDCDEFSLPSSLAMLHMIQCTGPRQRSWGPFVPWHVNWPIRKEEVECLRRLSVLLLDHCNLVRLPSNFHRLENLRVLRIEDGSMTYLPKEFTTLPRLEDFTLIAPVENLPQSLLEMSTLRRIKLGLKGLKTWPTPRNVYPFHHLTSLVELELVDLSALVELPNSFGGMKSLKELWMERCSALKRLPDGFGGLKELRTLVIKDCGELEELCESFHDLRRLEIFSLWGLPALKILPKSFGLSSLKELVIANCDALEELPQSFLDFQSLATVQIRECKRLVTLWPDSQHHNISNQLKENRSLEQFLLSDCPALRSLPDSVFEFILKRSPAWKDKRNRFRPGSGNLLFIQNGLLALTHLEDLVQLPECIGELKALRELQVEYCTNLKALPWSIGDLCALEKLHVSDCPSLTTLPESIGQLISLRILSITACRVLMTLPESLGQLPSLIELEVEDCPALLALPETIGQLTGLRRLLVTDCGRLVCLPECIGELKSLTELQVRCSNLETLPWSIGDLCALEELHVRDCPALVALPETLGQLQSITTLEISDCPALVALPETVGQLQSITTLQISDCPSLVALPETLGQLQSITTLEISDCPALVALPETLGQLQSSTTLKISDCTALVALPETLGQLQSITTLEISDCPALVALPETLGQLQSIRTLKISDCPALVALPETLGQLQSITALEIRDCTTLLAMPETIGQLTGLRRLLVAGCGRLVHWPKSTRNLKSVQELILSRSGVFSEFLMPGRGLNFRVLKLPAFEDCKALLSVLQQVDGKELEKLKVDISGVTITPAVIVCLREFNSLRYLSILARPDLGELFEYLEDWTLPSSNVGPVEYQPERLRKLMISLSVKLKIWPSAIGEYHRKPGGGRDFAEILPVSTFDSLGEVKSLEDLGFVRCWRMSVSRNSVGQPAGIHFWGIRYEYY